MEQYPSEDPQEQDNAASDETEWSAPDNTESDTPLHVEWAGFI